MATKYPSFWAAFEEPVLSDETSARDQIQTRSREESEQRSAGLLTHRLLMGTKTATREHEHEHQQLQSRFGAVHCCGISPLERQDR
jgi:hypothetical protein